MAKSELSVTEKIFRFSVILVASWSPVCGRHRHKDFSLYLYPSEPRESAIMKVLETPIAYNVPGVQTHPRGVFKLCSRMYSRYDWYAITDGQPKVSSIKVTKSCGHLDFPGSHKSVYRGLLLRLIKAIFIVRNVMTTQFLILFYVYATSIFDMFVCTNASFSMHTGLLVRYNRVKGDLLS